MKNIKMPSSIGKLMKDLGFDPKAPKTTQIAFVKYIARQMQIKKEGHKITSIKKNQTKHSTKKLTQASLFEYKKKKTA